MAEGGKNKSFKPLPSEDDIVINTNGHSINAENKRGLFRISGKISQLRI